MDTGLMLDPVYTELYDGTRRDYGARRGQTLSIHFDIIKEDKTYFSLDENRNILKWLMGNRKNSWLTLIDSDNNDICELYGHFINIQEKASDANIIGYLCEFECTSSFAHSVTRTVIYNIDSEQNFILDNDSDCLDIPLYPIITIVPQGSAVAEIQIINKDLKEMSVLKNIAENETVVIDGYNKILTVNDKYTSYKYQTSNDSLCFYGKKVPNDTEIRQAEIQVIEAEENVKNAQSRLEIAQKRLEVATQNEQDTKTARDAAKQARDNAEAAYLEAEKNGNYDDISIALANFANAKADYEDALFEYEDACNELLTAQADVTNAQEYVDECQSTYNTLVNILANTQDYILEVNRPIWPRLLSGFNHITIKTDSQIKCTFSYRSPIAIGTVINGVI